MSDLEAETAAPVLGHFGTFSGKNRNFQNLCPGPRGVTEGRKGFFENFDFFPENVPKLPSFGKVFMLITALKVRHFLRTIHIAITIDFIEDDTVSFIIIKFIADGGKEKK